jgi:cytoskeletal protein RodZ
MRANEEVSMVDKPKTNLHRLLIAILAVVVVAFVACGSEGEDTSDATAPATAEETEMEEPDESPEAQRTEESEAEEGEDEEEKSEESDKGDSAKEDFLEAVYKEHPKLPASVTDANLLETGRASCKAGSAEGYPIPDEWRPESPQGFPDVAELFTFLVTVSKQADKYLC